MRDRGGPIFAFAGLEATGAAAQHARDFFRRAVPMVETMSAAPGCLWVEAVHSGSLERAILSWWSSRPAIVAWYEHPAHQAIVEYGYEQQELLASDAVKTWIEFYTPASRREVVGERAVLVIGGWNSDRCLARRSLRTTLWRYDFAWVEPDAIRRPDGLVMRQLDWGVRTSADAGAPFSKARVLDLQQATSRYERSGRRPRGG